jgi:glycosyltransferase A (GT-A) superfamily protein (DUF2064 family)
MTDDDELLAHEIMHLTQRLNQALGAEIQYQQTGDERERRGAVAEVEAVRDEASALLEALDERR